ncbi:MAG: hypothetical protein ACI4JW_02270 [Oscillospiraceae bacterium]
MKEASTVRKILSDPDKRLKAIFIVGIIGIILILLSEFIPSSDSKNVENESTAELSFDDTAAYKKSVEAQLEELISEIKGVGKVRVMVTVAGTREYVFAQQTDTNRQTETDGEAFAQKGEIILSDEKDGKKPVVKQIISPQISGAAVVCEGADDPKTKERVINTVSAVLGLSGSKISVEPYQ